MEHQRALLQLIRDGGDGASWHWVATRAPMAGLPLTLNVMKGLHRLRDHGLADSCELGGDDDRWWLTPAGEAMLDGGPPAATAAAARGQPPGPLDADSLASLLSALQGDVSTTLLTVRALAADHLMLCGALRQAVAADESVALHVATAAMTLGDAERAAFIAELVDDPRAAVRAATFEAFSLPRVEVAGEAFRVVPDDKLDDLLRRGLADADRGVRTQAAKLTFAADRGAVLVSEVANQLEAPDRELRYWATLALGAARDALSRDHLVKAVEAEDDLIAGAAVRALAARPDGLEHWHETLANPRDHLRRCAVFALDRVVRDLPEAWLEGLRTDPRPEVRAALAGYLRRSG